jgi:hypothetical protein
MHCGEAQEVIPWKLRAPHAVLRRNLVWTVSLSQDFGLKLNWEAMGSDLVYSILSPEWNADKTRVDKVRCGLQSRLFRGIDLCRSESEAGSMEEAGSGHEDSSHNILIGFCRFCLGPR